MVVGDIATSTDVLVIGGGPGGYVAAIRAAQLGMDTTLVERDALGGTCLNYGCIPSKALITATNIAHHARRAEAMGIHADVTVDMQELVEWKAQVVDRLTGGVEQLCKAHDVTVVEGTATFIDDDSARIAHGGEGQGSESIDFEQAIIATGSRAMTIPEFSFEDERIWSSRDALEAEDPPDELVVIGGGYIGMEVSTVFAKAGSDVRVIEMLDEILPGYDADIATVIRDRAADLGIEFHVGERVVGWNEVDGGTIEIETETDEDTARYPADRALVAVGREPVTGSLDLEAAGLETDDRGFLPIDERCRTAVPHIFAVGDVTGEPLLAHKASAEGLVAAGAAAGEDVALDQQAIPAVVFTDPEIGTVGFTEEEAREAGFEPVVGEMPLRASGRALTMNDTDGFVRIVADEETGFVLGGQIVAPEASELIGEVGLAIEMAATVEDIARTVHPHPTLSEAIMEAAANARGEAIHTLNR